MQEPDLSHLGDARIFIDGEAYADLDAWHAAATRLRRNDPLPRVEVEGFPPFRVVTRHDHLAEVERNHDVFHNTVDSTLASHEQTRLRHEGDVDIKTLIHMDGKEHREVRAITNDWFKPGNLRKTIEGQLAPLSRKFVDRMADSQPRCDFARDIAMFYPLHVIMGILGVPEEDEPLMLELTQNLFGSEDPELAEGDDPAASFIAGLMKIYSYFQGVTTDRRAHPTGDVATAIANAKIDGNPLEEIQQMGYYAIVATAGHDTTASSLAGGLHALIEHPDQLQAITKDASLIPNAVDEMIRWVTPVRHFMRQAQIDYDLDGHAIARGDWLLLSYLSANRDESVFERPLEFDIRRNNAGDHLAFGIGVHFCLGAHLAKMELRAFLEELLPRLEFIELAEKPDYMATTFVGGPKRMPVNYRLRPA
ncbi:MAG: cytochrome P450 [Candidatus Binatia bacterium]